MPIIRVTPSLSISPQPDPSIFKDLDRQGFTAVLNNRPDNEDAAQPGSAAEERAAHVAGLAYHHIPVTGGSIAVDNVRAFQAALAASPGPVLAHCKSGMRSLMLHIIGEVLDGRLRGAEVRSFGEALGFDLSGAEAWLAQHDGARS
jgi:uncharacterized protein (TIGR01244 family)